MGYGEFHSREYHILQSYMQLKVWCNLDSTNLEFTFEVMGRYRSHYQRLKSKLSRRVNSEYFRPTQKIRFVILKLWVLNPLIITLLYM